MYSALDVAQYVIEKYWQGGSPITNLKLQKILYYIQGYAFKRYNEPAYSEDIYRWPYGPVVPEVYFEYNRFRGSPISEPSDNEMTAALKRLKTDKALLSVVDSVIDKSVAYTAAQLVEKTHNETPWQTTKDAEIIPPSLIDRYFTANDPLQIEDTNK